MLVISVLVSFHITMDVILNRDSLSSANSIQTLPSESLKENAVEIALSCKTIENFRYVNYPLYQLSWFSPATTLLACIGNN